MTNLTDSDVENATAQMQRAQESYQAELERKLAQLYRGDGLPKYTPAEHAEREKAVREAAAATRDQVLQRYEEQAEAVIAESERQITMLEGADRLSTLRPEDAARANARQGFVQEDVLMPVEQVERRVAAVIAAGDVVEALLLQRYLRRRLESEASRSNSVAIHAILQSLDPLTTDPDSAKKRTSAEQQKQLARKLRMKVWDVTRPEQVDALVQRMRASGAYSL